MHTRRDGAQTNPLVAKLPDDAYRVFRSGGSRLLGALMPFWYIGTFLALIAGAVVSRNVLTIAAVALMAGGLAFDGHRARAGWVCSSRCSSP